jgi:drug/metabolite transporter (DMT)-like permease
MERKDRIDAFGAASLVLFSVLVGFNQVVIKVVNDGLQPVFSAGLRSTGAILCVGLWMWARGIPFRIAPGTVVPGLLLGVFFGIEFLLLFLALDLTGVARISVIFYSMPVWLTIAAHFLLPGDTITRRKALGLALALAGVAWAMADRDAGGVEPSLAGDLAALAAAVFWAGIALVARATPISREAPEIQLFWQVVVSAVLLMAAAPFFGPLIRDLQPIHLWGLAFLTVVVVSAGFIFWFWLLKVYPASGVASFSFLAPVFGVIFGWLVLGEEIGLTIIGALVLVAAGIVLINRPARAARG